MEGGLNNLLTENLNHLLKHVPGINIHFLKGEGVEIICLFGF